MIEDYGRMDRVQPAVLDILSRRLFTQRLHDCQAKQFQGPQLDFSPFLKAPLPKLAGPPQVVQTLAKAKKLCPHQAQQRLSSLSPPKRDPD